MIFLDIFVESEYPSKPPGLQAHLEIVRPKQDKFHRNKQQSLRDTKG